MRSNGEAAVAAANQAAADAWGGPLFERLLRVRRRVAEGVDAHGELAFDVWPPYPGDRALDIGCGFGDTTRRLAELVGAGEVVGIDIGAPFVELAVSEAEAGAIRNVEYRFGDAQVSDLGGPYDYVYSRLGVMFFADTDQALANIRTAMRPGARLCFVVWRRKADNAWIWEVERALGRFVDRAPDSDESDSGPFSMADADVVTGQLRTAGFQEIELRRCDLPMPMGKTVEEAVDLTMALGAAGEALRQAGDRAKELRPQMASAIGEVLRCHLNSAGVELPASTWVVSAVSPEN